jgi:molybdate/tungstate transport system ATP-binding protein
MEQIVLTLKIVHVSKTLGAFSMKDISLEVGDSEYFVLLGPTGAGKTVLLEAIMGFHRPDKGKIVLNDLDVTDVPTEKRKIGYVPQNCPLFPHMNVFENVEFGLKMRQITVAKRKKSVNNMLRLVGLEQIAERMPHTLSGGEKQKVVLARVLVTKPKFVLLDEPLSSIDAKASRDLRNELKRINHELKLAVIHVTHDQIEAFSLGDRVAVMRNGEIVQIGRPSDVLSNPVDEFVARFLGYENVFQVKLMKYEKGISEVNVDNVGIRLAGKLDSGGATVAVRPEDIMIISEIPRVVEEWNIFEGEVKEYVNLGPIVEVTMDAGLVLKVFVDKRSFLESKLVVGKRTHVGFRIDSVKVVSMR